MNYAKFNRRNRSLQWAYGLPLRDTRFALRRAQLIQALHNWIHGGNGPDVGPYKG
jgi:hypothetical protein